MPALKDAFRRVFAETAVQRGADYVVHVNRDGAAGVVGDVMDGRCARAIGVVANPLGVNRWNGRPGDDWTLVRLCLESLSPDMERAVPVWDPDRWPRLAARYGLPRAERWATDRPADADVVLLLPKVGGWLKMDTGAYVKRYSGYVRELRAMHPDSEIVVRAHPRNVTKPDAAVRRVFEALPKAAANVRLDTTRSVSEEQYGRTKLVACDWSTAVMGFVMRGVPVYNPDLRRPGRMLASAAVDGNASPDEVMNAVCQSVFPVDAAADDLPAWLMSLGV